MSYAYADGIVWVDELDTESHPMTHDLCGEHASRITPPRGWDLRIRRRQHSSAEFEGRSFDSHASVA